MDKRNKIIIILAVTLAIFLGIGTLFLIKGTQGKNNEDSLSRAQWIMSLGKYYGMNEYTGEENAFNDINKTDEAYPYIQSCNEWGVLQFESDEFHPNKPASYQFIVETAILAAGIEFEPAAELETAADSSKLLTYALKNGLINSIDKKELKKAATIEACNQVLQWSLDTYKNKEFVEYENIVMQDTLLDISEITPDEFSIDENIVYLDESYAEIIEEGKTFILPGDKLNPFGFAYKAVSVSEKNGKLEIVTTEPEIGDIYQELEFGKTITPTKENILLEEGVTFSEGSSGAFWGPADNVITTTFGNGLDKPEAEKLGSNFSKEIRLSLDLLNGTPKLSTKSTAGSLNLNESLEQKKSNDVGKLLDEKGQILFDDESGLKAFEEKGNEWKEVAPPEAKYTGGIKINGDIVISMSMDVDVKTKKFLGVPYGIDSFVINTHADYSKELSVVGYLKSEIKLFTASVPLAFGINVQVDVFLYMDINGELKLKTTIDNGVKLEYSRGRFKKISTQEQSSSCEMKLTVDAGGKIRIIVKLFSLELIDADMKAGVLYEYTLATKGKTTESKVGKEKTITREILIESQMYLYAPIVKVSIGQKSGTLAYKFNIRLSCSLFDKPGKNASYDAWERKIFGDEWSVWKMTETINDDEVSGAYCNLSLDKFAFFIKEGENVTLSFTSLPSNYTESDLICTSNNGIVSVNGLSITGLQEGASVITVATPDGKFSVSCSVIVSKKDNSDNNAEQGGGGGGGRRY